MDVVLQWYVHVNIACTQHVELKGKKNVSLDRGCVSRFSTIEIALFVLCACYDPRVLRRSVLMVPVPAARSCGTVYIAY